MRVRVIYEFDIEGADAAQAHGAGRAVENSLDHRSVETLEMVEALLPAGAKVVGWSITTETAP